MKFLAGWKTVAFNAIMATVLVLNQFGQFGTDEVPTEESVNAGLDALDQGVAALLVIGNVILRAITKTTIFKKTSPAPMPDKSTA